MKFISAFVFLFAIIHALDSTDCSKGSSKLSVKNSTYLIETISNDYRLNLFIYANNTETIYNGTVVNTLHENITQVATIIHPICYLTQCPIKKGLALFNRSFNFKKDITNTTTIRKVKVEWKDDKYVTMLCISIKLSMGYDEKQVIEFQPAGFNVIPGL